MRKKSKLSLYHKKGRKPSAKIVTSNHGENSTSHTRTSALTTTEKGNAKLNGSKTSTGTPAATSPEIERLHEDIKLACQRLEECGHESFLVTVSSDGHMYLGSEKGRQFLETKLGLIEDFIYFCIETLPVVKTEKDTVMKGQAPDGMKVVPDAVAMEDHAADSFDSSTANASLDSETASLSMDQTDTFEDDTDDYADDTQTITDISQDSLEPQVDEAKIKADKTEQNNVKKQLKSTQAHVKKNRKRKTDKKLPKNIIKVKVLLNKMKEVKILSAKGDKSLKGSKSQIKQENKKVSLFKTMQFRCDLCGSGFKYETHLQEHNERNPSCKDKTQLSDATSNEVILQSEVSFTDKHTGEVKTKTIRELLNKTEAPFECEVCGKSFDAYHKLKRHVYPHAKPKPYECNICCQTFNMRESLRKHMIIHNSKPFHCSSCLNRYRTVDKLESHKLICTGDILKCMVCDYEASTVNDLKEHKKTHPKQRHAEKTSCNICGKELNSAYNVVRHKQSFHTDDFPYQCKICGKKYKVELTMRRHTVTHGEPKHHCKICDYSCYLTANMRIHMVTHTRERRFVCDFCGNQYRCKNLLDNHRRLHTGERPYICDFEGCGKSFRSLMTLKQHKCSHATSYAYICDVCGKSFKVRNQLRHHRKDHEVEFRWPCQYCEEKFKSCDTYKNHIAKTHPDKVKDVENGSNMKFYPCTHCTRILINIEDLREHMNVHTGNKPHKCRFCGKGFSSRKNMRQHEKSHTGEQNLRCHLCPKKYSDPTAMQAHMMRVHHLEINPEVLAEKRVVKNIVSSGPKVSVVAEGDSAVTISEKKDDQDTITVGRHTSFAQQFPPGDHMEEKYEEMEFGAVPTVSLVQEKSVGEPVRIQLIPQCTSTLQKLNRDAVVGSRQLTAVPVTPVTFTVRQEGDSNQVGQQIVSVSPAHQDQDDSVIRNIISAQSWTLASVE